MTLGQRTMNDGTERRMPYAKPTLSVIGEVRTLTLGSSGTSGDGKDSFQPAKKLGADTFLPVD